MYRYISRDLKLAAVRLYERSLLELSDILDCLQISRATFFRVLALWRTTGDVVVESQSLRGKVRFLHSEDIRYLCALIDRNPQYFLDELLHLLKTNRFISLHYTTIHKQLCRAGLSCKRLRRIAAERNEQARAAFISRIAHYTPEELGFVDEVSKDERSIGRHYGRSKHGRRAHATQPFVRGRRTSTIACLTLNGFTAGMSVEGSLTKESFLYWLENIMVSAFPSSFFPAVLTTVATQL
jgi:transposase